MKRGKALKNRILGWMIAGVVCITGVSMCLTSCQFLKDTNTGTGNSGMTSAEKDAYDAKIVYYEAQIQTLTSQVSDMEQQFYALRSEYLDQLQELEKQLANQQTPTPPPTTEDEPSGEDTAPPKDNQDDPTGNVDVVLCEYTYRLENNFAVLTSYLGNEIDVVVPAAVDGYLVIGLGDSVFAECDIKSVTLPKTVERLGWFTFYQCENLEKVVLPAGISNIGYASFDGCSKSLCLYVTDGSYAEQYALSFGLNYQKQT